jgi:protein-disulfide isomerase
MAKKSSRKRKRSASTQHRTSRPVQQDGGSTNRWLLWGLIALGVVLVLGLAAVGFASTQQSKTPAATVASGDLSDVPVDRTSMGRPDAPVLVETYEDFLCPHCATFNRELGPTLKELVQEGKVRWEFKYRVIFGADAYNADLAAECAADQGKFWEYHDALFEQVTRRGKIAVLPKNLKKLAADMGLDEAQFNECFDKKIHLKEIKKIDQLAAARGVQGTPTIFINGERYTGPFEPDAFTAAIEAAANQ